MSQKIHHAMILAAGFGTRLRPFTHETPKPLLEVLGVPLIENALRHAKGAGAREVIINTHHLGSEVEARLGNNFDGMRLQYSHETEILGTGGGIREMAKLLDLSKGPFLVLNSDALCDFDVEALCKDHQSGGGIATMLMKTTPDQEKFGTLSVTETGRVMRIVDWPALDLTEAKRGMFLGAHIIEPELLDFLPESGMCCIVRAAYVHALSAGRTISSYFTEGDFSDVGTPERLLEVTKMLLDGSFGQKHLHLHKPSQPNAVVIDPSAEIAPGAVLEGPAKIGPRAKVESKARIGPGAVIGADCRVGERATIENAVMFSGSTIEPDDSLKEGIVSRQHRWRAEADAEPGKTL